jgi:hypothetical protein
LAIGGRDGALGSAQGVARFALRRFLSFELFGERIDTSAQRLQLLVLRSDRRCRE